jgi:hypothetical protein
MAASVSKYIVEVLDIQGQNVINTFQANTYGEIAALLVSPLKALGKSVPAEQTIRTLVDKLQPVSSKPGSRFSDYIRVYKDTRPKGECHHHDSLKLFVKEMCNESGKVSAGQFEKAYREWSKNQAQKMEPKKNIKCFIEETYKHVASKPVMYEGISLKTAVQSDEEEETPELTLPVPEISKSPFFENNKLAIKMLLENLSSLHQEYNRQCGSIDLTGFVNVLQENI